MEVFTVKTYLIFLVFLPLLIMSACSSNNGATPVDSPAPSDEDVMQDWGNYTLTFDPETLDVQIEYDRENAFHFEITSYLNPPACGGSGCILATLTSWNPVTFIASFDVQITNPSPYTPSDVRMIFHSLGLKEIANADSYTREFVGSIEPFIAFGKANPNRIFPGGTSITETIDLYWPPMTPFGVNFKVGAWLWINCKDPYEINWMYQTGDLYPGGGAATIGCRVLDWQADVTSVVVDTMPITGGTTSLTWAGGTLWNANITNSVGAPVGIYTCLIAAASPNPQNFDLYNYLDIEVIPQPIGWTPDGTWTLPQGPCTLDFGIIADAHPGHALTVMPDPTGACNKVVKHPLWGNPPALYADLVNLDPADPSFQPYPVVRIDAVNDGAFGWTNDNPQPWFDRPVPNLNMDTFCNMNRIPAFISAPINDDHRHSLWWQNEVPMRPIDTSDTFRGDSCALYGRYDNPLAVGFQGIQGSLLGQDHTDMDMEWEAIFPSAFVGPDEGQVDPNDTVGIDCWAGYEPSCILVYIALGNAMRVEVFMICDIGPGPIDLVSHHMTIKVQNKEGYLGHPIDIELLPQHDGYEPNPNWPNLHVLIDNSFPPAPPPGFGGSVWIYDALSGIWVDRIGDSANPAVDRQPAYLDTDDREYATHIMQLGPVVSKFKYF